MVSLAQDLLQRQHYHDILSANEAGQLVLDQTESIHAMLTQSTAAVANIRSNLAPGLEALLSSSVRY